jgi:branched-chain amino acid transport system substrate-binding protein
MAQGAGEAIKGVYGSANWDWQLDDAASAAFTRSFGSKYGQPPSQIAQTSYVQALLYADAVERAGTFYPPEVIKALEGFEFDGMGNGPTLYRAEDHQCLKEVLVVQGRENPSTTFDVLQTVQKVGRDVADYDASIFEGELGPYDAALCA